MSEIKGQPILNSTNITESIDSIRTQGFSIIEGLLSDKELSKIRGELTPFLQRNKLGRNNFEGYKTERVYALLDKAPSIARLIEHPVLLELLDQLLPKNYLLSAALAINVHPGETPQPLHRDDTSKEDNFGHMETLTGVSMMWAIDDFTEKNGATEFIPKSHIDGNAVTVSKGLCRACMPAGSVFIFDGRLRHRGGANQTASSRLGITPQYCAPHLRQIESMLLAVPPEVAVNYSERVQELLGYSINDPGFMGYVDGRHPKHLIDPGYKGRKYRSDLPNS